MACPSGSYKAAPGPGNCTLCPAGKFSDVGAAVECSVCRNSCRPGFVLSGTCDQPGTTHDAPCSPCPINTYIEGGPSCISCDSNAQSAPGSPSASSCKCNAGFTIVDSFDGRCCVYFHACKNHTHELHSTHMSTASNLAMLQEPFRKSCCRIHTHAPPLAIN